MFAWVWNQDHAFHDYSTHSVVQGVQKLWSALRDMHPITTGAPIQSRSPTRSEFSHWNLHFCNTEPMLWSTHAENSKLSLWSRTMPLLTLHIRIGTLRPLSMHSEASMMPILSSCSSEPEQQILRFHFEGHTLKIRRLSSRAGVPKNWACTMK